MIILAESDIGFVGFEGNELTIGSKIDDPPKVRLTAPCTEHGGGGGVISFNYSRSGGVVCDGHQQTEIGMIRVEQSEDVRGDAGNTKAEFNVMLGDGTGVGDVVKPLAFVFNRITRSLLGLFGAGPTDTMWAPSGLFFTQQQADGNFVSYQVDRPFDKGANPKALWSAWTGKIG